jgi:hypothetical protein
MVLNPPETTPCVRCGEQPTIGFCHAGVEGLTGRICREHAKAMAKAGMAIALDKGGGRNWEAPLKPD